MVDAAAHYYSRYNRISWFMKDAVVSYTGSRKRTVRAIW